MFKRFRILDKSLLILTGEDHNWINYVLDFANEALLKQTRT